MHFCLLFYFVFFSVRKEFQASECHKSAFISTHPVNIFWSNLSNFNVASFTFSFFNFFLSQEFTPYKKKISVPSFPTHPANIFTLSPNRPDKKKHEILPEIIHFNSKLAVFKSGALSSSQTCRIWLIEAKFCENDTNLGKNRPNLLCPVLQ